MTVASNVAGHEPEKANGFRAGARHFFVSIWHDIENPLRTIFGNAIITVVIILSSWLLFETAKFATSGAIAAIPIVKDIFTWVEIGSTLGVAALFFIDAILTVRWKLRQVPELQNLLAETQNMLEPRDMNPRPGYPEQDGYRPSQEPLDLKSSNVDQATQLDQGRDH
jgi:hypothetical protein